MKIPNLNTLSTFIDRLCIENVKKAHFIFLLENSLERDSVLEEKIRQQEKIIDALQLELVNLLDEILSKGKYEYFGEIRTFQRENI